ncbi:unnamed protein product, partial [Discosporangium mesarthrocarpum]
DQHQHEKRDLSAPWLKGSSIRGEKGEDGSGGGGGGGSGSSGSSGGGGTGGGSWRKGSSREHRGGDPVGTMWPRAGVIPTPQEKKGDAWSKAKREDSAIAWGRVSNNSGGGGSGGQHGGSDSSANAPSASASSTAAGSSAGGGSSSGGGLSLASGKRVGVGVADQRVLASAVTAKTKGVGEDDGSSSTPAPGLGLTGPAWSSTKVAGAMVPSFAAVLRGGPGAVKGPANTGAKAGSSGGDSSLQAESSAAALTAPALLAPAATAGSTVQPPPQTQRKTGVRDKGPTEPAMATTRTPEAKPEPSIKPEPKAAAWTTGDTSSILRAALFKGLLSGEEAADSSGWSGSGAGA